MTKNLEKGKVHMGKQRSSRRIWGVVLAGLCLVGQPARAGLFGADLEAVRTVSTGDWLRVRLEVLGLRLTYPAYRIQLELDQDRRIAFTFMASAGMAEHLLKLDREEAAKVLSYHAEGISHQVDELIKADFPELWSRFEAGEDFRGQFLAPGSQNDAPPRELASWAAGKLYWSP